MILEDAKAKNRERASKWYYANREKVNEKHRRFRAENKDLVHARDRQRYLRQKEITPGFYLEPSRRRRVQFNTLMAELKSAPCSDCNKTFPPVAMDFDHVRGNKLSNVSLMMFATTEAILAEIAKCDLVCACCHRIRTEIQYRNRELLR